MRLRRSTIENQTNYRDISGFARKERKSVKSKATVTTQKLPQLDAEILEKTLDPVVEAMEQVQPEARITLNQKNDTESVRSSGSSQDAGAPSIVAPPPTATLQPPDNDPMDQDRHHVTTQLTPIDITAHGQHDSATSPSLTSPSLTYPLVDCPPPTAISYFIPTITSSHTPPAPLAVKPTYRKRQAPSDGLIKPVRSNLHRPWDDPIMGRGSIGPQRIGVVGAGSLRHDGEGTGMIGVQTVKPIAAKSLRLILHDELTHEENTLADLHSAVQAHLSQLQIEEGILKTMLDCDIQGVVVPPLSFSYVHDVEPVVTGVEETTDMGMSGIDEMEDMEEREDGNADGYMSSPHSPCILLSASASTLTPTSDSDSSSGEFVDDLDEGEEEDEEMARKALSMMLEKYGDGVA
ncbi:hypothetical protein BC937DRAFT_86597 [Endogone sp. FLAS-F59071]|nr:hypothetical protein BC937DRAFT_86597 [Endogone sp. FLAS-F59071]|eukprot:RUS19989.1 hypothetical protein BC937DRAFT_86597 [Endogone sp. FLAS-F59071]